MARITQLPNEVLPFFAKHYHVACDEPECVLRGVNFHDRDRARFAMRNHVTAKDISRGILSPNTSERDYNLRWVYASQGVVGFTCCAAKFLEEANA